MVKNFAIRINSPPADCLNNSWISIILKFKKNNMKNRIRSIFAIFFLCINSCTLNDVVVVVQTAAVDGEATFSAYISMMEGCPVCSSNPYAQAAVAAIATGIGVEASGKFGRLYNEGYKFGKTTDINLPNSNLLSNNPYESFGIKHNLALNFINSLPDLEVHRNKIINYDKAEWLRLLKIISPETTDAQNEETYNLAKNQNIIARFNQSKYESLRTFNDFDNYFLNLNLSEPLKTNVHNIFLELEKLSHVSNSLIPTIDYLNTEIQKILNSKSIYTMDEQKVLIFLSTYKHSLFYWKK